MKTYTITLWEQVGTVYEVESETPVTPENFWDHHAKACEVDRHEGDYELITGNVEMWP